MKPILASLLLVAVVLGGAVSWFASTHPDGLEWSISKATGKEEFAGAGDKLHEKLATVQSKTAFLPDYKFKVVQEEKVLAEHARAAPEPWPAVSAGTSVSGIVGGLMTLALAALIGFALKARVNVA